MARILQIRRGTAAQNDNFTGLAGELTFDTDTKTLRIHDGIKLGGYVVGSMNAADIPGDGTFDINTVSPEFWQDIVTTYAPAGGPQIFESRTLPIGNVAYAEYIWNDGTSAKLVQAVLVCQTPEADYAIGDVVAAFGIGTRAHPVPITFSGTNGLHVRLPIGGDAFWVCHKTTGVPTNITNARWQLKFIIWY